MSYSRQVFNKASEIIAKRRSEAIGNREEKYLKCVIDFPEIAQLEKEVVQTALSAPKAIFMGNDGQKYIENLAKKNLNAQNKIAQILKNNNFPEDYLDVHYTCSNCSDTGFKNGMMCDCLKDCMKNLMYASLSDKLPIKDCTFEKFNLSYYPDEPDVQTHYNQRDVMQNIKNFCVNYANNFSSHSDSLLFRGETGLGKTHLSLAIAEKVIEKGFGVIYCSAQNFFNLLEEEKFSKISPDISYLNSVLSCDLLIIDDLGSEFSTQFTVSALYNIINSRLLENKPVIISTNLSPEQIEQKYSSRIASRIYGNYKYLIFCGRDIRQLKSQY